MTKRTRPPATRRGTTHKIEVTGASVYVTLNRIDGPASLPCEIFVTLNNEDNDAPIDAAHQGWANLCCTFASLLLQYGCPLATIEHIRTHNKTPFQFLNQRDAIKK
jgi:hypothetical protein